MNITNIRIYPTDGTTPRKASVGIVIDNAIAFHGLKIVEGKDGKLFVAMPSRKNPETNRYDNIYFHPVSAQVREELEQKVLEAWEKVKANPETTSFDMGDPSGKMELSSIRIRDGYEGTLATVSAILDGEMVLQRLRIREARESGATVVSMPARKGSDGSYMDVYHPVTSEARQIITDEILAAYTKWQNEKAAEE